METKEMTVTEALAQLKLTKKKIGDAQNRLLFGFIGTNANTTVPNGFKTVKDFQDEANRRLQQYRDLQEYANKLKKAIVLSNAATDVKIGESTMKVAEAIERKTAIANDESLLLKLKQAQNSFTQQLDQANSQLEAKADKFVTDMYGVNKDKNAGVKETSDAKQQYIDAHRAKFFGIDNVEQVISKLEQSIYDFRTNVDVSLSVVNSTTKITV